MRLLSFFLILVATTLGACAEYVPIETATNNNGTSTTNGETPIQTIRTISDFDYPIWYKMDLKKKRTLAACKFYDFKVEATYPQLNGENFIVEGTFILPRGQRGPVPVVALFPPIGGRNAIDNGMADSLCLEGISTFIATTDISGIQALTIPDVEDHNQGMYRTVAFVKSLVAHAKADPALDGEKIGVLGASLGGILSVFAMSVIPDVSAGFFAVAGGDFPSILTNSNQKKVRQMRDYRMAQKEFSLFSQYEDYLRNQLRNDPLDFVSEIPTESVRMVISKKDRKVPTENQWLLHKALGEPEVKVSRWGHTWTIITHMGANDAADDIAKFFVRRFKKKSPRIHR